jgi:hypothetical protein
MPTSSSPTTRPRCASASITCDDLAPLNEQLIYASFTGYGEVAPSQQARLRRDRVVGAPASCT